jgi:hypothetical protein
VAVVTGAASGIGLAADRPELAALAHGPAAQLLRVGVDRIQVAAIAGDRFVADALLALPGRARYRFVEPEAPIGGDLRPSGSTANNDSSSLPAFTTSSHRPSSLRITEPAEARCGTPVPRPPVE